MEFVFYKTKHKIKDNTCAIQANFILQMPEKFSDAFLLALEKAEHKFSPTWVPNKVIFLI